MKKSELIQKLNEIEGDFDVYIYDHLKASEGEPCDGYYKLNSDDVFLSEDNILLAFKNPDYDYEGLVNLNVRLDINNDGTTPAFGVTLCTSKGNYCIAPDMLFSDNYIFVCMTKYDKFDFSEIVDYDENEKVYRNYNLTSIDDAWDCHTAQQSFQSFLDKHEITEPQYVYKIS